LSQRRKEPAGRRRATSKKPEGSADASASSSVIEDEKAEEAEDLQDPMAEEVAACIIQLGTITSRGISWEDFIISLGGSL